MKNRESSLIVEVLSIVLIGILSRVFPHPYNFTPVIAISLFSGFYFSRFIVGASVAVLIIFISDIFINNFFYSLGDGFTVFYSGFFWQYFAYIFIVFLSKVLTVVYESLKTSFESRKHLKGSSLKLASVGILGSLVFFVITNFGVWFTSSIYERSLTGLVNCYTAGLPFLSGTVFGTLFYGCLFFGVSLFMSGQYFWTTAPASVLNNPKDRL